MLTYAYVCIFEEVSLPKISSFKNVPHKRFKNFHGLYIYVNSLDVSD